MPYYSHICIPIETTNAHLERWCKTVALLLCRSWEIARLYSRKGSCKVEQFYCGYFPLRYDDMDTAVTSMCVHICTKQLNYSIIITAWNIKNTKLDFIKIKVILSFKGTLRKQKQTTDWEKFVTHISDKITKSAIYKVVQLLRGGRNFI
jgi:hypothetical protein